MPPWLPRILHQMGLQMSDDDRTITDVSGNWKRVQNDRLQEMFYLGRTWEVAMRQEYVRGIKSPVYHQLPFTEYSTAALTQQIPSFVPK